MTGNNRKGIELTIQTIVILVIALTLLLIVLYFVIQDIGGPLGVLSALGWNLTGQLNETPIGV